MLCIDLSSAHGDCEYLDASTGHPVLRRGGRLLRHATIERGAHREEADLRCVLSRRNYLSALFNTVPYSLLSFAENFEILQQVRPTGEKLRVHRSLVP